MMIACRAARFFPWILAGTVGVLVGGPRVTVGQESRDVSAVEPDLTPPQVEVAAPAAGRRVRAALPRYAATEVHHTLYLPQDWRADGKFPVIVEYAGNGPYRNNFGDTCSGKVEDCKLGFGIGGGRRFIWICLPYVSADHRNNQLQWWGDVAATVAYCKEAIAEVCDKYGGDREALLLAGFSRGAIACNYIGLHDDEIARLWRGFVCHSHYDGVRRWGYADDDQQAAAQRLRRLGDRPQFISHELSIDATRDYLAKAAPQGRFTFQPLGFRNHTDAWALRDLPERRALRAWVERTLNDDRRNSPAP